MINTQSQKYISPYFCSPDSRITACSEPEIRQVASAETGVASVDIPLLAGMFNLDLTPGNYPAKIASEKANCTINIKVLGMCAIFLGLLRARLVSLFSI